jgi:hypothetical protein
MRKRASVMPRQTPSKAFDRLVSPWRVLRIVRKRPVSCRILKAEHPFAWTRDAVHQRALGHDPPYQTGTWRVIFWTFVTRRCDEILALCARALASSTNPRDESNLAALAPAHRSQADLALGAMLHRLILEAGRGARAKFACHLSGRASSDGSGAPSA